MWSRAKWTKCGVRTTLEIMLHGLNLKIQQDSRSSLANCIGCSGTRTVFELSFVFHKWAWLEKFTSLLGYVCWFCHQNGGASKPKLQKICLHSFFLRLNVLFCKIQYFQACPWNYHWLHFLKIFVEHSKRDAVPIIQQDTTTTAVLTHEPVNHWISKLQESFAYQQSDGDWQWNSIKQDNVFDSEIVHVHLWPPWNYQFHNQVPEVACWKNLENTGLSSE